MWIRLSVFCTHLKKTPEKWQLFVEMCDSATREKRNYARYAIQPIVLMPARVNNLDLLVWYKMLE